MKRLPKTIKGLSERQIRTYAQKYLDRTTRIRKIDLQYIKENPEQKRWANMRASKKYYYKNRKKILSKALTQRRKEVSK